MSSMSNGLNYFIQLTESGQTVNLSQISSVSWHEVPAGCGWEESGCVATISFTSSYICITANDAQELWEALNRYNTRFGQAVVALPELVNALAALVEVELLRSGFEEYASPPQPVQSESVQSPTHQQQQQPPQTVPPVTRSAGGVSAGPTPAGSGYSGPEGGAGSSAGKVRVNAVGATSDQPVGQRQRQAISQ